MWSKLKAGDTVYVSSGKGIEECKVTKVGRKFIYVDFGYKVKFEIDGSKDRLPQVSNYSPKYYLYLDKKQLEEEIELKRLNDRARAFFRDSLFKQLDLEFLRKVNKLIDEIG